MSSQLLIRAAGLYVPTALTCSVWMYRRPSKRQAVSAVLAGAWCVPWLLLINVAAQQVGWWRFHARGGLFIGVPVDLFIGWTLLWGPLAALVFARVNTTAAIAMLAALDLLLMPLAAPILELSRAWLLGEALAIGICLLPAQLLARWTEADVHVRWRAALQAIAFTGITAGVAPVLIISLTAGKALILLGRT
ncbi:MAG: isoprenylcysteine carboxylmethyltransferase family protein, partial [Blastocatellia bacterium]